MEGGRIGEGVLVRDRAVVVLDIVVVVVVVVVVAMDDSGMDFDIDVDVDDVDDAAVDKPINRCCMII
jgi:hypothetical protein